ATSPFYYDWHRLRVAGLVVAAVLCVVGIIVLLS
ncbi:PREDICTED: FXYD domain-containing ion transport regulator 3-like, partial [Nestor notabilis]